MHTKGPWNISKHGTPDHTPQYGIYTDNNDFCIVKGQDAEANARLIAAAPDLLEALEAVYPFAEIYTRGTTDGQPILDMAQKAIRKATAT